MQQDGHNPVSGVELFATSGELEQAQTIATGNALPEHFEITFVSTGGNITLGLRTVNATANWIAADNFTLTYFGEVAGDPQKVLLDSYIAEVEAQYGDASSVKAGNEAKLAYTSALAAAKAATEDYEGAKNTLQTAVTALQTSTVLYAGYLTAINAIDKQISMATTDWPSLAADLRSTQSSLQAKYNAGTADSDEMAGLSDNIYNTCVSHITAALQSNAAECVGKDVTLLLRNPGFDTEFSGWTVKEGAIVWGGENVGPLPEDHIAYANTVDGIVDGGCAEVYHRAFDIQQTVKNLPVGVFTLSCQAFERDDNGAGIDGELYAYIGDATSAQTVKVKNITEDAQAVALYLPTYGGGHGEAGTRNNDSQTASGYTPNGMSGSNVYFRAGLYRNYFDIEVGKASDIRLGIRTASAGDWVLFDDFKLVYKDSEVEKDFVAFADAQVKAICVEHWDANGNGELSEKEAAAVRDLGTAFNGQTEITTFDELRYFTGLTSIADYAFSGSGLTSVTLPGSVNWIGQSAFDCPLTSVTVQRAMPPTLVSDGNPFTNSQNATLNVPRGSKEAYEAAEYWQDFKEIVEYDSDDINTLAVSNVSVFGGQSAEVNIELNNGRDDLVAFQMDITLPEGVSLDREGCRLSSRITDEDQELTVGRLETGAYRLTSTSLSLTPISGTSGALLTLKLDAADGCTGGLAKIGNIRFSTANSVKETLTDVSFAISTLYTLTYTVDGEGFDRDTVAYGTAIEPKAEPVREGYTFSGWNELPETMPAHDVVVMGNFYLYGDVNTDSEVDVVDVVDIARFVVATPSLSFREELADLNLDNTVDIADAVTLVNHIAGDQNYVKTEMPGRRGYDYEVCGLELLNGEGNGLSLHLDGEMDFTACQFTIDVPEDVNITALKLNAGRKNGHQLLYNKTEDGSYRVVVLSLKNRVFNGTEGELLSISLDAEPTADICIRDIRFVTTNATGIAFDELRLTDTDGVETMRNSENETMRGVVIYDANGRRLAKKQRGINIVGGRKVLVK